ncbi:MAG: hypothetical protein PVJ02_13920, partial [Gemmatimonadota bacterium]
YVCTGLQDNGSWCGPSAVRSGVILAEDWYRVGGGDGFYSQVDPTDYHVVFSESQGGNLRRVDMSTGEQVSIRPHAPSDRDSTTNVVPAPPAGTEFRWNWNTPVLLSPHNPRTIYAGGNRLFISRDRGDTWTMTPDLTRDVDRDEVSVMGMRNDLPRCSQDVRGQKCIVSRNDGVSAYSTLTTVAESPLVPGLLWVGSDDGNVQVSRDGGTTWTEVGRNIPGGTHGYYVSRVEASRFDPAAAYVSLDGHRSDDLKPYVFVTRDYGASWSDITGDLPATGNVNTVRQDPRNASILYAGTEFGFYISGTQGTNWQRFMPGLPVVRVDDVVVHPRDNDLVLATHGRSIWIMDDVTALQAMTDEMLSEPVHLFHPRDAVAWKNEVQRSRSVTGDKTWVGQNAPEGTYLHYYLRDAAAGDVVLTIEDPVTGKTFRTLKGTGHQGLNRVPWNLRGDEPPDGDARPRGRARAPRAEPGVYRVGLSVDGQRFTTTVRILEDTWLGQR